mgnify:FL=1
MGYFSECAIDYVQSASYERVDYSYPTKQETLNYYLEDLTSALEKLDEERPHDPLHPEYDRYFYSTGKYRYFEVLWAERVTVQDLLAAIAEVQELIRVAGQENIDVVDNDDIISGQITMVGFFHPLAFQSRICTTYGG